MNDPFVHEQSGSLAKRVLSEAKEESSRVQLAYELTQARLPDADDIAEADAFLSKYRESLAALGKSPDEQQLQAWAAFSRMLLTGNGFLYLD